MTPDYLQRDCPGVGCVEGWYYGYTDGDGMPVPQSPCTTCTDTPEGIEPGKVGVECETCEGQGSVPKTTTPERDKGETFSPCPDCINGLRVRRGG